MSEFARDLATFGATRSMIRLAQQYERRAPQRLPREASQDSREPRATLRIEGHRSQRPRRDGRITILDDWLESMRLGGYFARQRFRNGHPSNGLAGYFSDGHFPGSYADTRICTRV